MTLRALHIGINNYRGTANDLEKCVADARAMQKLFGGVLLLDAKATRKAILTAIAATVKATKPGDSCVITYSGHGSQTKDGSGDEPDGLDETLVAADLINITDDEFPPILSKLPAGAAGLFITDSCYSGTAHRAAPALGRKHLPAIVDLGIRYMPAALTKAPPRVTNLGKQPALKNWAHISGCTDFEFAFEGPQNGVLTDALVQCYSSKSTIGEWFKHAAEWVAAGEFGNRQHPQLNAPAAAKKWRVPSL